MTSKELQTYDLDELLKSNEELLLFFWHILARNVHRL